MNRYTCLEKIRAVSGKHPGGCCIWGICSENMMYMWNIESGGLYILSTVPLPKALIKKTIHLSSVNSRHLLTCEGDNESQRHVVFSTQYPMQIPTSRDRCAAANDATCHGSKLLVKVEVEGAKRWVGWFLVGFFFLRV